MADPTTEIDNRVEFALWANARAQEILVNEGSALALAARDMDDSQIQDAGLKLGAAIAEALLEVFDGLTES
ncbi:hypothetical protein [Rhizobium sp.]|jgi:hypothetical protein|uniref:hypothetical protein n=1 Tax=Rhizobium sp. TaxID=391 RepID=UPI000E99E81E|nr:hypothetical protein [Rhizobium sp.]